MAGSDNNSSVSGYNFAFSIPFIIHLQQCVPVFVICNFEAGTAAHDEKQNWAKSPSTVFNHFATSGLSVAVATSITHPLGSFRSCFSYYSLVFIFIMLMLFIGICFSFPFNKNYCVMYLQRLIHR